MDSNWAIDVIKALKNGRHVMSTTPAAQYASLHPERLDMYAPRARYGCLFEQFLEGVGPAPLFAVVCLYEWIISTTHAPSLV